MEYIVAIPVEWRNFHCALIKWFSEKFSDSSVKYLSLNGDIESATRLFTATDLEALKKDFGNFVNDTEAVRQIEYCDTNGDNTFYHGLFGPSGTSEPRDLSEPGGVPVAPSSLSFANAQASRLVGALGANGHTEGSAFGAWGDRILGEEAWNWSANLGEAMRLSLFAYMPEQSGLGLKVNNQLERQIDILALPSIETVVRATSEQFVVAKEFAGEEMGDAPKDGATMIELSAIPDLEPFRATISLDSDPDVGSPITSAKSVIFLTGRHSDILDSSEMGAGHRSDVRLPERAETMSLGESSAISAAASGVPAKVVIGGNATSGVASNVIDFVSADETRIVTTSAVPGIVDAGGDVGTSGGLTKNIISISLDDLISFRAFLNHFPDILHTPNIDRLMSMGVNFDSAFAQVAKCNASRTSILTGLRPEENGVHGNNALWYEIVSVTKTLPYLLSQLGYSTSVIGKVYHEAADKVASAVGVPFATFSNEFGWSDTYDPIKDPFEAGVFTYPMEQHGDYVNTTEAIRQVESWGDGGGNALFLGIFRPHAPFSAPQSFFDLYPLDTIPLPITQDNDLSDVPAFMRQLVVDWFHEDVVTAGMWKSMIQSYFAGISFADAQVGRLLDAVEREGRLDDTAIVLWSDHGYHLGDKEHWHKFTLWEESARAPLIIYDPDHPAAGRQVETPVELLDIMPTILEILGISVPDELEGKSLVPFLTHGEIPTHGTAFTSMYGSIAIRTESHRFILYEDNSTELYDIVNDPNQFVNLSGKSSYAETETALRTALLVHAQKNGWIRATGNVDLSDSSENHTVVFPDPTAVVHGGMGNDVYFPIDQRAVIVETQGGGIDTVYFRGSFQLADNVENAVGRERSQSVNAEVLGNELGNNINSAKIIWGMGGDDILRLTSGGVGYGGTGNDSIQGSDTSDLLDGGDGNDSLSGLGGADTLRPGAGSDRVDGGSGTDIISFRDQDAAITISLATKTVTGTGINSTVLNMEGIEDTRFNDVMTGDAKTNTFWYSGGSDVINGGSGMDLLILDINMASVRSTTLVGPNTIRIAIGLAASGQTLSVSDVERFRFSDTSDLTMADLANFEGNVPPSIAELADLIVGAGDGVSVTIAATDPNGDSLTLSVSVSGPDGVVDPSSYSFVDNNDGTGTFYWAAIPGADTSTAYMVTVLADDGFNLSVSESFEITISHSNSPPVAGDDVFVANGSGVLSGNVIANDSDPDGDTLRLVAGVISTEQGGTVAISEDGSFEFTGAPGFNGVDAFHYVLEDGNGSSDIGTVEITVPIENLTLTGRVGAQILAGRGGNDQIQEVADATWAVGTIRTNALVPGETGTLSKYSRFYDQMEGYGGTDTLTLANTNDALLLDDSLSTRVAGTIGPRVGGVEVINAGGGADLVDLTSATYTYGPVTIYGGAGVDRLWSSSGVDLLDGGPDADHLLAAGGGDLLRGGFGNDTLVGGSGADVLVGGPGNDIFVVQIASQSAPGSRDTLKAGGGEVAFLAPGIVAGDVIDLRGVDANENLSDDQAFTFGTERGIGRLWVVESGSNTIVRGNVDSDAAPEIEIVIIDGTGIASVTYALEDFLL